MRNTLAIARKELNVYFTTPMAYVMFCGMTVMASYFFIWFLQDYSRYSLIAMQVPQQLDPTRINLMDLVVSPLLGQFGILIAIVVPFLSMKLLAEERRQRTMELLMTTPVRATEIVLGKFLACFGVVALTLLFTVMYPVVLHLYGGSAGSAPPVEWATVATGYLGLLGWAATAIAIGLFISSLTESQTVAALITLVVLLVTWVSAGLASKLDGPARELVLNVSPIAHLRGLLSGEVAVKDLVYFASLTVLGLFLCQRTVEAQRWS